jgi:hypothetical protein
MRMPDPGLPLTSVPPPDQRVGAHEERRALEWRFADLAISHGVIPIGGTDDPQEREAERVADQVMRPNEPAPVVSLGPLRLSRKCAVCEEDEALRRTPSPMAGAIAPVAPDSVHRALRAPGRPLNAATRTFFAQHVGHDFSRVRVHTDAPAVESARAVGASAYTVGQDIVFGAGAFSPESDHGRRLLAHELAHTLQQGGARTLLQRRPNDPGPGRSSGPSAPTDQRRVTKIILDKQSWQATFYFETDPPETRRVLRHCDPVPGNHRATVTGGTDSAHSWHLPGDICAADPGFVLSLAGPEPWPGTTSGETSFEFVVFGDMVADFVSSGDIHKPIAPDAQARLRISETIVAEGLTHDDLVEYQMATRRPPKDWADFEISFNRWLRARNLRREAAHEREVTERRNLGAAMTPASAGGAGKGLEESMLDVYEDYRTLQRFDEAKRNPRSFADFAKANPEAAEKIKEAGSFSDYERELRLSIEDRLKSRYDIIGIAAFEQRINGFEQAFRAATVGRAETILDAAKSVCDRFLYEVKRREFTRDWDRKSVEIVSRLGPVRQKAVAEADRAEADIHTAHRAQFRAINAFPRPDSDAFTQATDAEQEATQRRDTVVAGATAGLKDYPFVSWPDFPREKLLRETDPSNVQYMIVWYLLEHIAGIDATRKQIESDSKRIYKLDTLIKLSEGAFAIGEGSVFGRVISHEMEEAAKTSLADDIKTALQFALMIAAIFVPGAIGVAAAVGGALISADQAVDAYTSFVDDHAAYRANLASQDPSSVWVIAAIVGAGLDAKGAIELLDKLPTLRKAINEFSESRDAARLSRLSRNLDGIKELDAPAREAIERDAAAQVARDNAAHIDPEQLRGEIGELRAHAADPAHVQHPADPRYDAEMTASDGHELRREKGTHRWERCSDEPCPVIAVPAELDSAVDNTIARSETRFQKYQRLNDEYHHVAAYHPDVPARLDQVREALTRGDRDAADRLMDNFEKDFGRYRGGEVPGFHYPDAERRNVDEIERLSQVSEDELGRYHFTVTEDDLNGVYEQHFRDLPAQDWQRQARFSQGEPAANIPRRPEGFRTAYTQPDAFHPGTPEHPPVSLEAKNYRLSDGDAFVYPTARQAIDRAKHMPPGTQQWLIIDIRGQQLVAGQVEGLMDQLERLTRGIYERRHMILLK